MRIQFGYTPDTDDAFHYYALENGKLGLDRPTDFKFHHLCIQTLNKMALKGELEVTAVSSIIYPQIEDRYVVLSAGASVGRGYGPALGIRSDRSLKNLEGKTVAVAGRWTTGYFLLNYFYRGFKPVFMPYDKIAEAIEMEKVDAGVLIHEELLNYKFKKINRLSCLGERWFGETGLPLPVGLNVARRDLGMDNILWLRQKLEESMRFALKHPSEAMAFASAFSSGDIEVTREFVAKFANSDTANMPEDVRLGLKELFRRAFEAGFITHEPQLEII